MGAAFTCSHFRPSSDGGAIDVRRSTESQQFGPADTRTLSFVYLVDTNIIAAAAPSRPVPHALVEWMDMHSASLFLSAVTVAEIQEGVAKSRREGATRKSSDLAAWLATVLHLYGARVLAFAPATAPIARSSADPARAQGQATRF